MRALQIVLLLGWGILTVMNSGVAWGQTTVHAGFALCDITPDIRARPVWLAGYGPGRRATGIHDSLAARCVVLRIGEEKVAVVSVDLVGLQLPIVREIRRRLPDFRYVLVASTHNHEGPDVIGIWGATPFQRGVDSDYLRTIIHQCEQAVRQAERALQPVRVSYGTAADESLLRDSREPIVRDGVLRVVRFHRLADGGAAGLLVQWNCHPECLGSRNTLVTADFPHYAVRALERRGAGPVVYVSGAVGGLMAPPDDRVRDADGRLLGEGSFEFARVYGEAVADLAWSASEKAEPVELAPVRLATREVAIPVSNALYRAAQELGVIQRELVDAASHGPDASRSGASANGEADGVRTEVAYLGLGNVHVACIPGELYPELVYRREPGPPDPGADFPGSPPEPTVSELLPGDRWVLMGLANDEIGYIIPRGQWDAVAPFCFGRARAQYGESNSCGPDVAPRILSALADCVSEATGQVRRR
ncbi:MAG: hypothetical protein AB7O38_06725 [Pirellulaceae bacterium]